MPSRKPRQTKLGVPPKVVVRLTASERLKVTREILEIASPAMRATVARDLDRLLSIWASQLANVPNVSLRSDFLSRATPVAKRAETLWSFIEREGELLSIAAYMGFVDLGVLNTQLRGFGRLVAWMKTEKTKGGGERRAFRKKINEEWKALARAWFVSHAKGIRAHEKKRRESTFLRLAHAAVARALPAS